MPPSAEGVKLWVGGMLGVLLNIGTAFAIPFQLGASLIAIILIARLWLTGLGGLYWAVCAFIFTDAAAGVLALADRRHEIAFYQGGEALKVVFATVVFWDLSRRVFHNYPSLAEFVTRSAKYILPACVLLGVASFLIDPAVPVGRSPHLHLLVAIKGAVTSALLAYLLATGAFAGWFPVRMRRNVACLLVGFMVLFGTEWIAGFINNAAPRAIPWANSLEALVACIVCAYWLFTLNAAGEEEVAATLPRWNPDRLTDLTQQLDQMQAQLSRRGF